MISIEKALSLVDAHALPQKVGWQNVTEAAGTILADSVFAPLPLPIFDNSAMDGYALCGEHLKYKIVGTQKAGDANSGILTDGEAYRIFTGALIPQGTDTVVMQEHVTLKGDYLYLKEIPAMNRNIRRKGEELAEGAKVFETGNKLNPAGVGLLSSLGITQVQTFGPPKIGILLTGDELVVPGNPLGEGQIYEGNGAVLKAVLNTMDLTPELITKVRDDKKETIQAVKATLDRVDLLLISGGISVGEYDFVKEALLENGVEGIFHKVQQKPGKPLFFGTKKEKRIFAMPGNPASLLTCFYVYVQPMIAQALGRTKSSHKEEIQLLEDKTVSGIRPTFFRALRVNGKYQILDQQGSSMLHAFAQGDALVLLQPGQNAAKGEYLAWHY
ncbi:MAG: molybdopterin molybdotransferase MoeA [Bacteroidota bacterium]